MPPYSLDTNTCVQNLRNRDPALIARIVAIPSTDIRICSVVRAELYHGAYRSQRVPENIAKVSTFLGPFASVLFDDAAAEEYGRPRAFLERQGRMIGPLDLQIAAIALVHGPTLVTHNTREFANVPGLALEDWQTTP